MSTLNTTNIKNPASSGNNIVLGADGSVSLELSSLNGGPLAGFRNRIINGNFDIWQRGTSFSVTAANTYTADRWLVFFDGTGATRTISQQSFTPGQIDVPNEPRYFLRFAQSVAGSGSTLNSLDQRIEDVRTFAGRQVTLSFWAKAAANATMPNVQIIQGFGTGGSPSANASTTVVSNVAVTTSWQRFSYQVNVPSVSGKTFGTNNDSTVALVLTMPLNATFTIDIAQVQIEPGSVATPFEQRPIGTELALCKRYAQWVPFSQQFYSNAVGGGETHESTMTWPVEMRTNPNVSALVIDPNTGQFNQNNFSNLIARVTPYGGSAVLSSAAQGASFVIGYRSLLTAEL